MNTRGSVIYGWGVLVAAGAGAYFFAKRSVNADRQANLQRERERAALQHKLREQELRYPTSSRQNVANGNDNGITSDSAANPSREASSAEPAPTRHAPETEGQRVAEKSKYEASEVWRSKKGDRFSGF